MGARSGRRNVARQFPEQTRHFATVFAHMGGKSGGSMDTLVSTQWLENHLGDADLVVLDCSVHTEQTETGFQNHSGRASFDSEHIPMAGFADLTKELCDTDSDIEFALPEPEAFCAEMGALGVGDQSRVVLYDNSMSAWAARVWWMLRWVGFDQAAILDGGLKLWKAEGRALSSEPAKHPNRKLTCNSRPDVIADRKEVMAAIDNPAISLIDTLPEASYRGEMSIYGRPGHIPTAINICGINMLDETGRYLPREQLEAMYPADRNSRQITYCGGGILASLNAFVMTRLGFTDVAVYTASLQEWARDPANPMSTDG